MSLDISLFEKIEAEVVNKNITHNLGPMWKEAGIYEALYESEGKKAKEVLPILKKGLLKMIEDPEHYRKFDSPNGWGLYENAVPWLFNLIEQFEKHPEGIIRISR